MKPIIILCLALILSCASSKSAVPSGKLYETHLFDGKPEVSIYMHGFVDSSFNVYIKDRESQKLIFQSLPAMKSQFETTTNSIVRDNRAKRICADRDGVGMYDLFWSKNLQRFALAFQGNFVAAYDCKTGQKIQIKDSVESKSQCQALGTVIENFLDGKDFTEAEVADVRKHPYSGQDHQTNP